MIFLLALSLAACGPRAPDQQSQQQQQQAQQDSGVPTKGVDRSHAGQPIPATVLFNPDEEKAGLSTAAGKPMLVNLWASWCAPCVKELPTLQALSRRPGAPAVVLVSEDIADRSSVDAFLDSHAVTALDSWRDPEMALSPALGAPVMPTTIFYDSSGREVWRYVGDLDWTGEEAAKLLAGNGSPSPSEVR